MLGIEELAELEEKLKDELFENLTEILTRLPRTGQLESLLTLLGMSSLLGSEAPYQVHVTGKILVIGQADVKEKELYAIGKRMGISKDRFELHLNYNDGANFNFNKVQYNPEYSVILVGPMPHSGVSKGNASSVITNIEREDGYPPVIRLGNAGLKISKSNFKDALSSLLLAGKLKPDQV